MTFQTAEEGSVIDIQVHYVLGDKINHGSSLSAKLEHENISLCEYLNAVIFHFETGVTRNEAASRLSSNM